MIFTVALSVPLLATGVPLAAQPEARGGRDAQTLLADLLLAQGKTRGQAAEDMIKALEVVGFQPPACVEDDEMFDDVPASNLFCPFIEEVARRGLTSGCDGNNFCPNATLTRSQMATFLVRVLELPANLEDGQVTGEKIAEEAVGTVQLEDSGVLGDDIASGNIHSQHIADGTITADDIAQNTVYGGNIEDNSIHSADIHDGTISGADTDGGFWHPATRSNLYTNTVTGTVTENGEVGTANAFCDDADDIPVSGECNTVGSGADVLLKEFAPLGWGDPAAPAGYSCTYEHTSEIDASFLTRIHCLDVSP